MLNEAYPRMIVPDFVPKLDQETQEQKENIFKSILVTKLMESVKESFEDADIEQEYTNEFFNELSSLPEEEILSVLAMPLELRERIFPNLAKQLEQKKTTVKDFLEKLRKLVKERGYRLGFHLSNSDIKPIEALDGKDKTIKWEVQGSEKDHRDNDLLRAYYSLDYQNLYRKKNGKYLYLIRSETGPSSPHRRDNDNSWGRASVLPIVDRLEIAEVDSKIEEILNSDRSSNETARRN